jgi:hypothetical protein
VRVGVDEVLRLVRSVATVHESGDRDTVLRAVADLAAIRRWCDGREVALAGFMATHSPIPEKPMAKAARSSQRAAKKALRRNETARRRPSSAKRSSRARSRASMSTWRGCAAWRRG